MPCEIPAQPWEKVRTDLFISNESNFMATADYSCSFWKVHRLRTTIRKLKARILRCAVPHSLGPNERLLMLLLKHLNIWVPLKTSA